MKKTVSTQNTFAEAAHNTNSLVLWAAVFADLFRCGSACHGLGSTRRRASL